MEPDVVQAIYENHSLGVVALLRRVPIAATIMCILSCVASLSVLAVELTWHGPPGPLMADVCKVIIADYEKANPGIKVNLGSTGQSTQQKPEVLITQIVGGVSPDLAFVQYSDVPWWAVQGLIQPIDDVARLAGFRAEEFTPGAWASMKYEGKLYALPVVLEPLGLIWSHEALLISGLDPEQPPQTWDELRRMAKRVHRVEGQTTTRFGAQMAIGGVDTTTPAALVLGAQKDLPVADAKGIYIDDPRWQDMIRLLVDLEIEQGGPAAWQSYTATVAGGKYRPHDRGLARGSLGFTFHGSWIIGWVYEHNPEAALGVTTMPLLPGGKKVATAKGWSVAVPSGASHVGETMQFMRYVLSREPLEKWYRYQSSLPAHFDTLRYLTVNVLHELTMPKERLAFANIAAQVNVASPPPSPVAKSLIGPFDTVVGRVRSGANPAAVLNELAVQLRSELAGLLRQ